MSINMNPTPAPIEQAESVIVIECTEEERLQRLDVCNSCDKFLIEEVTKCAECSCNISLLTTFKFKECPLGKW